MEIFSGGINITAFMAFTLKNMAAAGIMSSYLPKIGPKYYTVSNLHSRLVPIPSQLSGISVARSAVQIVSGLYNDGNAL